MEEEKVHLTKGKEPYLATLYGKAIDAALENPILGDRLAADAVARIDYDFKALKLPNKAEITLAMRAWHFDQWTRAFLAVHPESTVLHLGCGLDTRVYRINPGPSVRWFDSLPLCQEVGDALVAFLKRARPASSHRELFLRWNAPFRPLCSSVSVCTLIQKLLRRAGVSIHRPGAHVLRHSLATQMVVRGGTFKEIADVLGHQSLVTTEIYAKLDLGSLSQVAMPWPGGNQ